MSAELNPPADGMEHRPLDSSLGQLPSRSGKPHHGRFGDGTGRMGMRRPAAWKIAAAEYANVVPAPAVVRANVLATDEPAARVSQNLHPTPPGDKEKYSYIQSSQHRWVFVFQTMAFLGVAVSLVGFSTMRYWTLIFLVPLAVYAAETLLGLRTSTFARSVTLPDHQLRVELWKPQAYPSVDVFLPTCGEDLALLANTYKYVTALQWPGELKVYVLDDAGRAEVADLAGQHSFSYLARSGGAFKKAGNLQHAFERTGGDHILLLDADFVPRPDFLLETIPYMDFPEVGIVQTPQFFGTPKSMNWLQRGAGATQELFYRMIQPSRDVVDAAICVGTSAVYRRSALAAGGGFPLVGHSEDVYTGLQIAKYGYRLQYVPIIVSKGICPADVDSFISQQYRWCEGSLELLRSEEFHVQEDITARQRLSYWSGITYYLSTAMNGFFAPLPALVMIWLLPQIVAPANMLPLIGVVILWLVIYPVVMKGRWRLEVLRVQTLYSFAHVMAFRDVFFGSVAAWVPSHGTARPNPLANRVRRLMGGYLLITQTALVGGLAYRIAEHGWGQWWATALFVLINLYIFVPVIAAALGSRWAFGMSADRSDPARVTNATTKPALKGSSRR